MRRWGFLGLALFLVACDDEPADNQQTVDAFAKSFEQAYCERAVRCGWMPDVQTCVGVTGLETAQINADLAAKRAAFNEAATQKCISAFATMACDGSELALEENCNPVFTGTVEVGGACQSNTVCISQDCEYPEDCDRSQTCCSGQCQGLKKAIGDGCAEAEECQSYRCSEGKCAPLLEAGEACSSYSDCETRFCSNGVCTAQKAGGEDCTEDDECESFWCVEGKCFAPKAVGEDCAEGSDCESEVCTEGKCAAPVPIGGDCSSRVECVAYANCVEGKCVLMSKAGEACDEEADILCLGDLQCVGGSCAFGSEDPVCP